MTALGIAVWLGTAAASAQCDAAASGVVINEFVANPSGTDTDLEWVEVHNATGQTKDLSGWAIASGTSSYGLGDPFPNGTSLAAGGYLVVGQTAIPEVDLVAGGFSLGNASSNADALQLRDCFGTASDTIVYGEPNTDLWTDDAGGVASSLGPEPPDGDTLGRDPDGQDTDESGVDIVELPYPTPGEANDAPPTTCGGLASGIKINELYADPEGADDGSEWIEYFHAGPVPIDLTDWALQMGTSSFSTKYTWTAGTLNPGDRLLIGGGYVVGADLVVDGLSLGNATSSSDGVRLVDCLGFAADTVVYGGPNTDELVDDTMAIATSLAPSPGQAASLQRLSDGYDTDASGADFAVTLDPTPGAANEEVEPVVCVPDPDGVRINEFLPDPDGTDEGFEWIELHNAGDADVSVAGWQLSLATSYTLPAEVEEAFSSRAITIGGGVIVPGGGYLLVGGEEVEGVGLIAPFSLGNGTETDGIRLFDCTGATVDTVVYGDEPNADLIPDDFGLVVEPYGDPGSDESLARVEDGVDTDSAEDWKVVGITTPGTSNVRELGEVTDPLADGPQTCGCGNGAPPETNGGPAPTDPNGGCSTAPLAPLWVWPGLAGLFALRRRAR